MKLTIGTRIHYTGDMANREANGTVTAINPPNRFQGESVDICLDDGREIRALSLSNFAPGSGRRFWPLDEYQADYRRRIAEMQADALCRLSDCPMVRPSAGQQWYAAARSEAKNA